MSTDDPNAPLENGELPLHRAAQQFDQGASVRALLARGADPRATDRHGRNALWAALSGEIAAVVPLLAAAGADPNARDAAGELPLATVVRRRYAQAARALVAAGADPACAEASGATARGIALDRGDRALLVALLGDEARADAALAARPDARAIDAARAGVIAALRAGKTYYRVNKEGWTELAWSAEQGAFVEQSDGDSGPYTARVGDDAAALAYVYDHEAFGQTNELALWTALLTRWSAAAR